MIPSPSRNRPTFAAAVVLAAMLVGASFSVVAQAAPGDLDPTFSGDGMKTTDFFGDFDAATGVALQGNGKIVVVGCATGGAGQDFALARYNRNGSLDASFSGNGKRRTNFGGDDCAWGVALQGNGKIVVVGQTGGGDFALARYNRNGSLDASFSGNGKQRTDFGGDDAARGVALQGNNKIVVVGFGGDGSDFALARYNPDGSLDASFSSNGKQTTDFFGDFDAATGVALQSNNKIVVVGGATAHRSDFALARYNPDGSLDASFSGDGKQTTDFGGSDGSDGASGVALQGDGKVVAVGLAGGNLGDGADFALARYKADGSLDASFSGDGKQTADFGGDDGARGVALQGDGKIVAVGGGDSDFALARCLGG